MKPPSPRSFWQLILGLLGAVGLTAQVPPAPLAPSPVPTLPQNDPIAPSPETFFRCVTGFPRPGDPGQLPSSGPLPRVSGVYAFTDNAGTPLNPNDDVEYAVFGRSDGVWLVDATPNWTHGVHTPTIVEGALALFIPEQDPRYLGPRPINGNAQWGQDENPGLFHGLNGGIGTNPYTYDQNFAYITTYAGGSYAHSTIPTTTLTGPREYSWFYPWASIHTTNREVAVYYDAQVDKYFIYSISGGGTHRGIWIIPLVRNATTMRLELDVTPVSNTTNGWWRANSSTDPQYHNIYIDTALARLWVTEEGTSQVRCIQIQSTLSHGHLGSETSPSFVYSSAAAVSPHDAMPVGDSVYIADTGTSTIPGKFIRAQISNTSNYVVVPSYFQMAGGRTGRRTW